MFEQQYQRGRSYRFLRISHLVMTISFVSLYNTDAFQSPPANKHKTLLPAVRRSSRSSLIRRQENHVLGPQRKERRHQHCHLYGKPNDEEDEDDEDDYIDMDSLGDWRNFRRNLAMESNDDGSFGTPSVRTKCSDNERVLEKQNKELAEEYASGVWAHQTPMPEVGGLVVRMPLEVELYRNHQYSITGSKLRDILDDDGAGENIPTDDLVMSHWYGRSRDLIEEIMKEIASEAGDEGEIDMTNLSEDYTELLLLYLENQERWQEVCLVLEQTTSSLGSKSAKTLVLNRPMAFKLTKDLGRLVYLGAFGEQNTEITLEKANGLTRFMIAFQEECAVYIGGPDDQENAAILIHGIRDLPGAEEISPGSNVYRGGLEAAVDGVIEGKYSPLEFRFFVGCHSYEESTLDVEVRLGKYQPIACARALALKQCISLPVPLWHEIMELSDGDLPDISRLERNKHDGVTFQLIDETSDLEFNTDDGDDIDIEILEDDDDDSPFGW